MNTERTSGQPDLRNKAEEIVNARAGNPGSDPSAYGDLKIIHELEVYQVELEMQNDELTLARAGAEATANKYATLFDFAPMGYLSINRQGVIMELNLCACQMLGKDRSQLKSKVLGIHISDESKPLFNSFLENVFSSATRETCDITLVPAGSTRIWVHLSGIRTDNGNTYLLAMLDMTKRKEEEETLRKLYDKLNRAQRIAHIGNWDDNLISNELFWSDEMYHIMGLPPASSISLEEATSVFPPEELERFRRAVDMVLNHDVPYSMDYRIIRPDGTTRYIHDEGEVIRDEKGQPTWMFGTTQDFTDRKLADDLLKSKIEELERFQRLTVGRELTMVELKKEVNALLMQSGREEKYRVIQ